MALTLLWGWQYARAQTTPANCTSGYEFAFFNGVGNSYADAIDGLNALRVNTAYTAGITQDTPNDTYTPADAPQWALPVKYVVYYNTSGTVDGAGVIEDVAEVFAMRAKEADPSGQLANNYAYLQWDSDSGWLNAKSALSVDPSLGNFITSFGLAATNVYINSMVGLYDAPTDSDAINHQQALTDDATAGYRFLLVAHSQGNLFVNLAYNFIEPVVGDAQVKVVHIAPASTIVNGGYELSTNDLVINGLRLKGIFAVQANNLSLPFAPLTDPTGHTLVGTYLNDGNGGLTATQALIGPALNKITGPPPCVTLTPPKTDVQVGGTVVLNATLPKPAHSLTASYDWSIAGTAGGHFIDPVSGNNSAALTTTAPTITYNAPAAAADGTQDVVTLKVSVNYDGADASQNQLPPATSTITVNSLVTTITPSNGSVLPGSTTLFNVTAGAPIASGASYQWSLKGGGGSLGPMSTVSAGATTQTTSTASVVYNAPLIAGITTLSVTILDAGGNVLANTSTNITTAQIAVSPATYTIMDQAAVTLTASFAGVPQSATNLVTYRWTTNGLFGDLTDLASGGAAGQTSFCTYSNKAQFVDQKGALTGIADGATQTVTVEAFDGPGCNSANAMQTPASATMTYTSTTVTISPANQSVGVGTTQQFTANVSGLATQFSYSYQWTLTGSGDISESTDQTITYSAPSVPGTGTLSVSVLDSLTGTVLAKTSTTVTVVDGVVNVILTQPWTDTGITVAAGQTLMITATGTMDYWTGGCPSTQNCNVTPDGFPASFCAGFSSGPTVAPNLNCYSLIGQIGTGGTPFEVGSSLTLVVPAGTSGELYLGVNDNNFPDNTGSWIATIQ